jgi:uncharacterized membrane protein YphA (DoxX/SURF4 family)
MKIALLIARLLLGLIFLVFGLNGFLNFLSMGPTPTGLAGQFIGALFLSHYYWVVASLQIAGGLLLLVNRFVPLALVMLGNEGLWTQALASFCLFGEHLMHKRHCY